MSSTREMDLSAKTRAEIAQLLENAERMLADPKRSTQHKRARELAEAAQAELAARPTSAGARKAAAVGPAAHAPALLIEAGAALLAEFDLSPPPETRSPHALLSKDGKPKTGGRQRNKQAARELYISYKRGKRILSLGFLLGLGEDPLTGGGWFVHDLAEGEAAPDAPNHAQDFDAALAAFRAKLAEVAPAR